MTALILGWLSSHWLIVAAVLVGIAAWANPVLVWKLKAWILLAIVLWWGWTGHVAYNALLEQTDRDAAYASVELEAAKYAASEAARSEERTRDKAMSVADHAYQRGLTDGKAVADKLLADRDAGTLLLRDKFRCPAGGVPGPATASRGSDGGAPAVLSAADQEFLVRIGAEADDLARQLTLCQAVVRADRGLDASRAGE